MRRGTETSRKTFVTLKLSHGAERGDRRPMCRHHSLAKVANRADCDRVELLFDLIDRKYAAIGKEMGRDLFRARGGALETHEQSRTKLGLCTRDFLGIGPMCQQRDLVDHQP